MESEEKNRLDAETKAVQTAKEYADAASKYMTEASISALAAAKSAEAASKQSPEAISSATKEETKGKHLNDYVADFDYYSGKASEISRNLGFAGIAIVWFFRSTESNKPLIPNDLLYPLWFLVISLGLDLFQYLIGYIFWTSFYHYNLRRWKKRKITAEKIKDLEAPSPFSITILIFFLVKIGFMLLAYIKLFAFLYGRIYLHY